MLDILLLLLQQFITHFIVPNNTNYNLAVLVISDYKELKTHKLIDLHLSVKVPRASPVAPSYIIKPYPSRHFPLSHFLPLWHLPPFMKEDLCDCCGLTDIIHDNLPVFEYCLRLNHSCWIFLLAQRLHITAVGIRTLEGLGHLPEH